MSKRFNEGYDFAKTTFEKFGEKPYKELVAVAETMVENGDHFDKGVLAYKPEHSKPVTEDELRRVIGWLEEKDVFMYTSSPNEVGCADIELEELIQIWENSEE